MQDIYLRQLALLKDKPEVNTGFWDLFCERIRSNPALTRDEDPVDHFGSYCIPICKRTKRIYLGYHKKASFWLPPGGHINMHETPEQTAIREFSEELEYTIIDENVELVNVELSTINNPGHACRIHYDFWYVVYLLQEVDFKFSTKEYYTAKWVTIYELLKHNTLPHYIPIYKNLSHILRK